MAILVCTVSTAKYNSSSPGDIGWVNFTTASSGAYISLVGRDASKLVFLVAHETTKVGAGSTWYVGASGTACSGTSDKAYSAGKLGRLKLKQSKYAKAKAQTAIGRCTSSTRLLSIAMLGPFETARFLTTDGRIYLAKGKTGSTAARIAAILLP
jgi:hypothetical protein